MYQIGNFQPFRTTQTIRFKPINLIYGRNSSGKSAIIRSLLLLRSILSGGRPDAGEIVVDGCTVHIGDFDRYVHQGDLKRQVEFGLSFNPFPSLPSDDLVRVEEWLGETKAQAKEPETAESEPSSDKGTYESWKWLISATKKEKLFESSSSRIRFSMGMHDLMRRECRGELTPEELDDDGLLQALETFPPVDVRRLDVYYEGALLLQYADQDSEGKPGPMAVRYVDLEHPHLQRYLVEKGCQMDKVGFLDVLVNAGLLQVDESDLNVGCAMLRNGGGVAFRDRHSVEKLPEGLEKLVTEFIAYCHAVDEELIVPYARREGMLSNLHYVGPWRHFPEGRIMGGEPPGTERYRHKPVDAIRDPWQALLQAYHLRAEVNDWLQETSKLSSPYSFEVFRHKLEPEPGTRDDSIVPQYTERELVLVDQRTGTPVSLNSVGTGISQVIPAIVHLLGGNNSLLCVEQPELHLHPSMQAELGDAVLYSALHRGNCVIAETHSEHLLLRIMRRMRETANGSRSESEQPVTPADVGVFYVDTAEDCSFVRELELTPNGELVQDWPYGFFDDGLREVLM